jgi:hypothetical protein
LGSGIVFAENGFGLMFWDAAFRTEGLNGISTSKCDGDDGCDWDWEAEGIDAVDGVDGAECFFELFFRPIM